MTRPAVAQNRMEVVVDALANVDGDRVAGLERTYISNYPLPVFSRTKAASTHELSLLFCAANRYP
jgi:hypothetical protein